ncbi:MAG: ABC transporter ATP-binding protein [Mycobacteriales bacterium]|nr:ABC transporter ATP-binding protein [Frankia sp.]
MSDPILSVDRVSKRFRVKENRSLAEVLRRHRGPREFWALHDVSLQVAASEVVSVIGRNGAGKSTLLKICAGVSDATRGTSKRPQRIAPLIEVGAGFHPELSGRENVYVNARLLGLGREEVAARFDDIVAFAELERDIDRPVRQYSSGMFMRLGFSVAIHTDPQLLIVDEVLAVGDLPFQMRCLDRIREMRAAGVGVLFVSHNITAVLNLSDRAILLEDGRIRAEGDVSDVVGAYHQSLGESASAQAVADEAGASGSLVLDRVEVRDEHGREPLLWAPGKRAEVKLRVRAVRDSPKGRVGFRFIKDGAGMVGRWAPEQGPDVPALRAGQSAELKLHMQLNFAEGGYLLDVAIGPHDLRGLMLSENGIYRFGIGNRPGGTGIVDVSPELAVRRLR